MNDDRRSDDEVKAHFLPGPDGGLVCDICRCVVRAGRGDQRAHLAWHDRLEAGR